SPPTVVPWNSIRTAPTAGTESRERKRRQNLEHDALAGQPDRDRLERALGALPHCAARREEPGGPQDLLLEQHVQELRVRPGTARGRRPRDRGRDRLFLSLR